MIQFMSGVFHKSILKPGTYHSAQGEVNVTVDRLRHWESQVKRLQSAGYAIPMHWDHSSNPNQLLPVNAQTLSVGKIRSSERTAGRLNSFKVAKDGNSAEIVIETLTKEATEKVGSNAVSVSPVIFPEWTDGANQKYSDVITSIDLVDHPVDYSQGKFQPVLCSLMVANNQTPFLLSVQMDPEPGEKPENEDEKPDEAQPETDATPSTSVPAVLEALAKMSIVLPEDTTVDNFLDRLYTALLTAAAQSGTDEEVADVEENPTLVDPQIATMSLQAKNQIAYANRQYQTTVANQLQRLLEEGRCTPAEHSQKKPLLPAIKLSLNSSGEPELSKLEEWIQSRNAVPKGTFWSSEEKATKMSLVKEVDNPSEWRPGSIGEVTEKERQEAVNRLTQRTRSS